MALVFEPMYSFKDAQRSAVSEVVDPCMQLQTVPNTLLSVFCCNPETQALADPLQHPEFAMSSAEIASLLFKYKDWLSPRGGGVTVSGGEAMIQPDFVADLFKRVQSIGLSTCLDTACFGNKRRWDKILPHTDNVLLCLKGMDIEVAAKVAQVSVAEMEKSKDFARHIRDHYPNIKVTLRWVLLSGITDTDAELDALADFAQDLYPVFHAIELIPYHDLGREKYDMLDMSYPLDEMPVYKAENALLVRDRLEEAGIVTILSNV